MNKNETKKGMHYSHSKNFWRSRYWRIREALADDKSALDRFTSAVKDLDSFQVYWNMNGGRWERVVQAFKYPLSIEETDVNSDGLTLGGN